MSTAGRASRGILAETTSGKRERQPTPLSGEAADVAAHIAKGRIPEPVKLDRDETIEASATVHTDHRVVLPPG